MERKFRPVIVDIDDGGAIGSHDLVFLCPILVQCPKLGIHTSIKLALVVVLMRFFAAAVAGIVMRRVGAGQLGVIYPELIFIIS